MNTGTDNDLEAYKRMNKKQILTVKEEQITYIERFLKVLKKVDENKFFMAEHIVDWVEQLSEDVPDMNSRSTGRYLGAELERLNIKRVGSLNNVSIYQLKYINNIK